MIKYVTGDILLSKADAIAHGVAPDDNFKQGLALSLREQWPSLYKDFRHFCHTKGPKSGDVWSWKGAGTFVIYNMMTQEPPKSKDGHPGKASIAHVNHCLRNLKKEIDSDGIKSLAITKLATGVGGLDWEEVKPLLEQYFSDSQIPVYIYSEYHKGVAAEL